MSFEAELLVDRRRLQRRLTLWRFSAVVIVIALIGALIAASTDLDKAFQKPQLARVNIKGIISDNQKQQKLLKDIAKAQHVKAVLLHINSPGGTTTGGEALYESIRRLSEKKPVVAIFGTVAASAGYIAGLATDHIVSRGNTITGSVGVIFQFAEVSELLNKVGIKVEEIRSGPLKAVPSMFKPVDPAGRDVAQEMVLEAKSWFVGLVAKRRSIMPSSIEGLTDGRIFSGRQALKFKLVDQIGGELEAVKWLEKKKKVSPGLPIHNWKSKDIDPYSWLSGAVKSLGRSLNLFAPFFHSNETIERLRLDGLVSVWHPH